MIRRNYVLKRLISMRASILRRARVVLSWIVSAALVIQPTLVYALPTGGTVVGGDANIVAGASSLTVNQTTERALINWTGFDIGGAESVHFNQPGSTSISLNRVDSATASSIQGSISSNGQVWIVNPNGVMFGQGAQVNVGGLLVSTAGISDDNFMNGNYQFNIAGNPNAAVINDGNITVADAGVASLVAPVVRNNGYIQAKLGTVNLASGDTFALDLYGDGLINLEASAALQQQIVSNSGTIQANGGSVYLTAAAAGDMVDSLINMDGVIQANSIGEKNGTVVLYAEGSNAVVGNNAVDKGQKQGISTVLVSGTIEAKGNAAGEKGGNVDVLADHVGVMSGGFIDASGQIGGGKIRIGGDYFGGGDTPTALKTLVQRNTSIKANAIESGDGGRITVWADDTTWFGGAVEAKGGALSGNGGFIEVSGKQYLTFRGTADTRAENGQTGVLLLDPADIVIADGTADSAADGSNTFAGAPSGTPGTILSGDAGPATIYESELEGIAAGTNIVLASTNSITINDLTDNNLNLAQTGGNSVTFTTGGGGFNMNTGDTITTAGGALNVTTTGGTSTFGSIATNGGLITLNMGGDITVSGVISGTGTALTKTGTGALTLDGNNTYTGNTTVTSGDITVGHNNAFGTGTLVMNGGGVVDDGNIRTLANNVSVTANDSAFGGSAGLTLNGTTTFAGEHALLNYNSGTTTFGNINLSNSAADQLVTLAVHGGDVVVNGVIANGGTSTASSLRKNGAGTLILNGSNTFGGGITLATGTLQAGHNSALGTGTFVLNGGTFQGNGVARTFANNVNITADSTIGGSSTLQFDGTFGGANGTRYLDVSNSATTTFGNINISSDGSDRFIIFTGSGNTVVNGVVANGGGSTGSGLGLISSGSLTLNGNNTYGGSFYHDGGTLILGHDNALGTNNFLAYGGTIQGTGGTRTIANNISYWDDTTFAGSTALVFNGDFYNTNNLSLTNNNSATTTFSNIDLSYDASNFTLTFGGTGNTVIGGVISNGGGGSTTSTITKTGSGTLTLDGNNTYGGTTTLTAGTIEVGHNNALGTGALSLNGGTLQGDGVARTLANNITLAADSTIGGSSALQFDGTFGNLGDTRILTVNNSALTTLGDINISDSATDRMMVIIGSGDVTVDGVIANGSTSTASQMLINSSGTITFNGANTYGGGTTLTGGTLVVGDNAALGTGILALNGGTLRGDGVARTLANTINLNANSTIGGSSALQFDGTFGNLSASRTLTVNNSAATTLGNVNISNSAAGRVLTIGGTGNTIVNGVIANGSTSTLSGITKAGSGILTLNGANTYGGATTLGSNAGTIVIGNNSALGTGTFFTGLNTTVQGDGVARTLANNITMTGSHIIGGSSDLTFNGTLTHSGGSHTLTVNNSGLTTLGGINLSNDGTNRTMTIGGTGNTVVSGVVANGGGSTTSALTKIGAGTLTLDGNNTYGGTTTLTAGTIEVGHNNALGTGALSLNGGILQGDGTARTLANNITLAANSTIGGSSALQFDGTFGNLTADRNLTNNNSSTVTFGNIVISGNNNDRWLDISGTGTNIVNGVISSGGSSNSSIRINNSGNLTLNGANTHRSVDFGSSGILQIGNNSALGVNTFYIAGNGRIQGDGVARTLANNIALYSGVTIQGSSDLTFNGTLTHGLNNHTVTVNNSGLTTLGGINLSNDGTNRTMTIGGTGNTVVSGVVSNGSGGSTTSALTKTGSGTLTLDGNNTYGGTTTLTAGTIEVGHNNALGTGTLLLNGGTLQGDGTARTLANNVTLAANSTIGGTSALQIDGLFGNMTADYTLTVNNSGGTTFDDINISANATTRQLRLEGTGDVTVNGVIDDGNGSTSRLMKQSTGTLYLNGANTYSGSTYHFAGTVQVGNNAAFGDGLVWLMGDTTTRGDGTARTMSNTFRIWGNGSQNPVYIAGNSDLTFSGNFGYLDNALNRTVTVNNSGLTTFNNIHISGNATDRVLTLNGTGDMLVSGVIANGSTSTASGITKEGSGTLTLDGNNTYGGTTTLTAGTIEVGHNNALGTGTLSLNGGTLRGDGVARTLANNVTLAADSTIGGTSALQFDGTFGNLSGNRTLTVSNSANTTFDDINISSSGTDRELLIDGAGNVIVNGVIANGGGSSSSVLTHLGSGTLTLNGANTFGRYAQFNNGITQIGNDSALGSGSVWLAGGTWRGDGTTRTLSNNLSLFDSIAIAGSSDLVFNGNLTSSGDHTITNNSSGATTFANMNLSDGATDRTLTMTGTGNTVISGVIANGSTSTASGLTKTGSGTLTLDGNNTYGGTTTLTAGTIEVGHNNALGTGTLSLNGGTLQGDGVARTLANNITLAANSTIAGSSALQFDGTFGNLSADRTLTINNSATTTFDDIDISNSSTSRSLTINGTGNAIVNGVIADGSTATASSLIKSGSGTLTLNGNNTHGGQTIINGAIIIGHNNAFGDGSLNLGFGGSLQGDGVARTIANNVGLGAAFTIAGSSDLTFNGTLTNSWANNTLTINNSGLTTLNNINLSNNATDRTMTVAGTGDVIVSGTIANGSTSTVSGLTKTGAGILTLSGNNTYEGDTTINGGTLRLGAANRLANTTDVVIGASGTFDLNSFSETVATITNGGAITMGDDNTLTTTGAQTHTGSISGTDISIIANTGNLTFDTISANTLFAQAVAGDIILNDQITAGANAGTSITLVADDQFINNFGNTVFQTAGTARWLVYSEDSAANTRGGLGGFNRYGCTYNAGSPDCAVGTSTPATGNGFYFVQAPTITITGLTANNKVYDGNTTATLAGTATVNGAINGDTVTLDASGVTATFDTKDVGVGKTVTIAGYANSMGYIVTQPAAVLANITAKALTITGLTANNKVYNGNTTATLAGVGTLDGVVGAETVGFNAGTATFDTKDVGVGKTVTASGFTLTGADAGNYTLTQPGTWLANITAAALTITGLIANNKVYDGNTTATLSGVGSLVGVVGAETVGFNTGTATFDNANVGTGKTVTGAGFSLTGADMGNYSLTQPSWFADITAGSGGGGSVSSGNQGIINSLLSQFGLLGNTGVGNTANAGGTFQYAPGVPEPSRMDIKPVDDEAPAPTNKQDVPASAKRTDEWIEINAMIDLNSLIKEDNTDQYQADMVAAKSVPAKTPKTKQDTKDKSNSDCANALGNDLCASKIFSTIGVPNI